jgi:transcriptional regulator with XRE-family HTH domain
MSSIDCGRFIAQLRKDKRITQTELADLLQVTNKAISRWETGEGYPDVSMLPKLAEVLEVSIDELLKGERKDVGQRTSRRPYVKFVNAGFSSIVLIIAALILFLAITYSTYKVWLGVVGYLIPVVVAVLWFFNQRNELFETCAYTEEDKQLLSVGHAVWRRRYGL